MFNSSNKPQVVERRRIDVMEKGFKMFAERSIESVSMQQIADHVGCGIATLYRYFDKKQGYVVAIATWKWEQFQKEYRKHMKNTDKMTALEKFTFYLDSFLELYRNHRDLLRYNQMFNIYVQSEKLDAETMTPYQEMIDQLKAWFHEMYVKAQADHTLKTDLSEQEMFSATLHLMLAVVTRYAIGLVYQSGSDPEKELELQKELLLTRFKA